VRPFAFPLLLLAGCAHPDPRADAALFDSAEARARRDVHALYYSDAPGLGVASVLALRSGTAESHFEPDPKFLEVWRIMGKTPPPVHTHRTGLPVSAAQRAQIDAFFAQAPAGASVWSLAPEPPPDAFERRRESDLTTFRILHVSASGEAKTLTVHKGWPDHLPEGARPGGDALAALEKLFIAISRGP
jgi:hypothetical protein